MKLISSCSIVIICLGLFSCYGNGSSSGIAELQENVLKDISNSKLAVVNDVSPKSVTLSKFSNGKYIGTLITAEANETYTYDIKVETTGPIFEWEITSDGELIGSNDNSVSSSTSTSPCNMNSSELDEFLTDNNFSLNGNGRVVFDRNNNVNIYGGRADLRGTYSTSNGSVRISSLQAISGYFDASNNNGSRGSFSVDCNGDMSGNLHAGGEYKSVSIIKE